MKTIGLKHLTILLLLGLLPMAALAQFTDGVSLTVNGQKAQRAGNSFSMLSACGQNQAVIEVTAEPLATVKINNITQNPATVNLAAYGNNTVNITVTPQGGSPQNYTLIVNKPIPFHQIVVFEWVDFPTVNCNTATNGGYTFVAFKWFCNGIQIGTKPYVQIGTFGDPATNIYYVEMTSSNSATGIIRTCPTTIPL